jgi:hypothetical protein
MIRMYGPSRCWMFFDIELFQGVLMQFGLLDWPIIISTSQVKVQVGGQWELEMELITEMGENSKP